MFKKRKESKSKKESEEILKSVVKDFYSMDQKERKELRELAEAKNCLISSVSKINREIKPNVVRNSHEGAVLYPGILNAYVVEKEIKGDFKRSVDLLNESMKHTRKIERTSRRIYEKLERLDPEDNSMGAIERRVLSVEHTLEHDIKTAVNLVEGAVSHFKRIMANASKDARDKERCNPHLARDDSIFFIGHSLHRSPMLKIEKALELINEIMSSLRELFQLESMVKNRLSFWQRHNLEKIVTKIKK